MVTIWTYPLCTTVWNRNLWNDLLFEKHWCYLKTVTGKCFDQGTKKWRQETLHCYGQQLWFNCLPGTLMNRYILRMRGQNTRTRYLIHVELAKNTGPPDSRYERVLQLSGNRKRFPCLHSLMWTREGLGEFEGVESRVWITVENSTNPSSVYIRLCKHRKNVFYCFYNITFLRKTQNSLLWRWLKKKFLPVAKSCTPSRSCTRNQFLFCKKMLPKYGFFSLKMSA